MNNTVDPVTDREWQDAVDAARFFIALDSARQYGLVEGGPGVDVERCEDILRRGEARGFLPAPLEQLCDEFIIGGAA